MNNGMLSLYFLYICCGQSYEFSWYFRGESTSKFPSESVEKTHDTK